MPKVAAVVVCIAALVLTTVGTALAGGPLPGYGVAVRATLYPGVDYEQIVNPDGPVRVHVAHVAPGAAVDLRVVDAGDKIPTAATELEMTSSMCRRVDCLVAVNGDFHTQAQPVGGVVTGGRMLRSPDPSRAQLWVDDTGHLGAGPFPWSAALQLSDGTEVPITGVNVPAGAGPVLYTSAWGPATPPSAGIELVLGPAEPVGPLNRPVPVTLQGLRSSPGGIPAGGAVIAVPPSAADQVESAWARVQQGVVAARADLVVVTPVPAVESIGTTPVVLHGGQAAVPWPDDPNVIGAIQPRTIVGWNAAGDVYLVVVDGRQPASAGLTMAQAASLLIGLGATEAANLDGGGGSTFVVGGTVRNQPSDAPTADPAVAERVASNAFVLLARPGPSTPAAGGSVDPEVSSSSGGPGAVLGPAAPGSGTPPRPGPVPTASPTDPGGPGETVAGGLTGTGSAGPGDTAPTSGAGPGFRLPAAATTAARAGSGGDDRRAVGRAVASASPRADPSGQDVGGPVSGPLDAVAAGGVAPALVLPPGPMAGGVVALEWVFLAAAIGRRRLRRAFVGRVRRQPENGTGPGPSSRRWPLPRMWICVTGRQRQSPLALVTSKVALKR